MKANHSIQISPTDRSFHFQLPSTNSASTNTRTLTQRNILTLDAKLRWKEHILIKLKQLKTIKKKLYWMIGRQSKLSIHNKLMLYKQIMKPVWIYGIQLWGCSKASNINKIQIFQNKVLRNIVDARWYMRNTDIRKDTSITTVEEEITKAARNHELRLVIEISKLYDY